MNTVLKIPILGVTKEVKEYERKVISYLKSNLLYSDSNIELEDISFYNSIPKSLEEAVATVEKSNGKVIFLTDAEIGNTKEYELVAKEFYVRGIRPFLLITHIESAKFNLREVSMRPTYLAEYFDRRAEWYHQIYQSLYFNYDTKGFLVSYEGREENIGTFIKSIKNYVNIE